MNVRKAVVLRMEGNHAIVKVTAEGGCGRCSESGGCGSNVLGQLFRGGCRAYAAETSRLHAPGSTVDVSVAPEAPLLAAMLAYGLPLAGLLIGAAIGSSIHGDPGAAAGALLGLAMAALAALGLARRRAGQLRVRVVEAGDAAAR